MTDDQGGHPPITRTEELKSYLASGDISSRSLVTLRWPASDLQRALTVSSSNFAVIGELVAEPETYGETPTEPAA
jgi:hypothetical protein